MIATTIVLIEVTDPKVYYYFIIIVYMMYVYAHVSMHVRVCIKCLILYLLYKVGQPPARGPDPAQEGLASGPPLCSAITLQSGPRNPSQTKVGFMSEITSRECTNSEHFSRHREQRCTLRRLLIKYKNYKSRCRQTNSNNYNVGLSHALAYLQRAQVTVSHNPISSS